MSTPIPPDEPDEGATAEHPPVQDAPPAPAAPAPPPGPYAGPPAGYPYPYPFAPRVREPWINPAKRSALALVAAGLAIVLLAGGFIVGAAVAHRHDRVHSVIVRDGYGRVGGYGMPGRLPYGFIPGRGMHMMPRGYLPGQRVSPATPAPSPTSSHR